MKTTKILTVLTAFLLIFSLAACGTSKDNKKDDGNKKAEIAALMAMEPGTKDEATELHQKLMEQENAILSENSALWEKVFLSANKGIAMIEDGGNYGDFLLKTIDGAKDQFKADELKLLNEGAEQIREIEGKLTVLEQKFPGCGKKPSDGDMSVPAENGKPTEKGDLMKFPAFDGKDLDGNEVKSSTLFAENTVTVVNFWFTTCSPCVGELADLEALNKQLAEKGGAVNGYESNAPAAGRTFTIIRRIRTPLKETIKARLPENFVMESAARCPGVYFCFPLSGNTEIVLSVSRFNTSSSVISRRISFNTYLNSYLFFYNNSSSL